MLPQVCLCLLMLIKCHGYQSSWDLEYNRRHRTPQDAIVDVVNNLALKLLAIHNEGNDNNIAISPYGAVSVLVALLEGIRGDAGYEIQHAANIPSDLSVVRIGLRDINRHLKSYFIPEEGFLSGLTLSHENVTLNQEYEDILKFYGYDINSFNNALYPDYIHSTGKPDEITTDITSTEKEEITTEMTTSTTENDKITTSELTSAITTNAITTEIMSTTSTPEMTTTSTESITTTKLPSTTSFKESTTITSPITTSTTESTTTTSTSTEILSTTMEMTKTSTISETEQTTTTQGTTLFTSSRIETGSSEENKIDSELIASTTILGESDKIQEATTAAMTTTQNPSTVSNNLMEITTTINNVTDASTEDITSTTEETTSSSDVTSTEETSTSDITTTTNVINDSTTLVTTEYDDNETTESSDEQENNKPLRRSPRSLVDYVIARYYDDHSITQRPPPYNSEKDLYFLVNGKYKESNINYMTYDTVLPFYYIPHLNTLALRFPLDSSKYYLLLLLPNDEDGVEKLICDLRLNTSLKYIINNLRYTHVKAIIPSFMLKGYIILTSTFQKMGVRKVFEPRHADFSPMTTDPNIYVTNIEQAITVNIRNYVDPVTMNSNRYLHQNNPVLFKADHPFLYFVIDSEIDVTLMAGKVINPLNSRIR